MTTQNIDVDFIKQLIQDEISKIQSINKTQNTSKNNAHIAIGIVILGIACSISAVLLVGKDSKPKNISANIPPAIYNNDNYSEYINKNQEKPQKFYKIDTKPFSRNFPAPPVTSVKNAKIYLTDRNKLQQKVKKLQHEDEISKIVADNHIKNIIRGQ